MLRNPNDDVQDKLNKFWTSLSAWMVQQEVIEKYFRGEYTEYDNGWNGGTFYLNIDYEQEYKIQYGESYPEFAIGNRGINIDEIKDFVEIINTLEQALSILKSDNFDFIRYKKLVFDAGALIQRLKVGDE